MGKQYLVYWVIHDGDLFENHPELICATQTNITPNFDQKQLVFGQGKISKSWPEDVSVLVSGTEPVDFLLCTPYIEIVSNRAKDVIEDLANDEVEFLPVEVFFEDGKPYMPMKYWAINILLTLDALDWEQTIWTDPSPPRRDNPLAALSIIKPCLLAKNIENHHFFRIRVASRVDSPKYISRELKQRLENKKFVLGMEFGPIKAI
ncbi:MAG TPA: hypothetical protein PKM01_11970, partial [Anaerolineaceae bacterium]|nr:hypothetical protein [Anaerolineaceae bacterium]